MEKTEQSYNMTYSQMAELQNLNRRLGELVSRDNGNFIHTPEEKKQMEEGLEKFHKIFLSLWW